MYICHYIYRVKDFWNQWLVKTKNSLTDDDYLGKSVYEVMKIAIENDQYLPSYNEYEDVKRVVKFRIRMPREAMKKTLGIDTWSIYGSGLFTVMEGILLSKSTRNRSGYDTKGVHAYFDTSFIPEDIRKTHVFSLAVPALDGLFVPKYCSLTRWMSSRNQIQYFDLTI